MNIDVTSLQQLFDYWCKKLRIIPCWDVRLEFVDDVSWNKTGDIKIDCDTKKAIVLINRVNPKYENLEEVLVHELFHLKLYPLDQVTESLLSSHYKEGTPEYEFVSDQFFLSLEQTVEELAKCFLLEFGENKELSFKNCQNRKSFNELFDGLKSLK
ncbi:hypothetical protein RBG61_02670 [Paludicola sp. MB14-C6]|uniref:hypothetical protein n=1 Tax=Paludihabitans sp. MB14-C6 TaxID=3070656 RepID=UPI0027DAD2C0|nr:hypothetical protein [Paludicola sp. MB14-C6]WMJ23588.1 hypothetical protein RBG61_02670 [Paludicola sp. MB14-C6]